MMLVNRFHDSGCFTSFQSSTFKMCVTFSLKKTKQNKTKQTPENPQTSSGFNSGL